MLEDISQEKTILAVYDNRPDDDEMTEFSTSPLLLSPTKSEPLDPSTELSSMTRIRNASFRIKPKHKQLLFSNAQHEERVDAKTKKGPETHKTLLLSPGRSSSCSNIEEDLPAKNLISVISGSLPSPPLFATPKISNIDFASRKQHNGRKTTKKDSATNPLLQSQANSEKRNLLSTYSNLLPPTPLSPAMKTRNRSFTSYKQFYPKEEESRTTNTMLSGMRIRRSRSLSGRDSEASKKKALLDKANILSDDKNTRTPSLQTSIRNHRGNSLSLRDSEKKADCYSQLEEEENILVIPSPAGMKKDKTLSDDKNTSSRRARRSSRQSRRGRSVSLRESKSDEKETLSDDDNPRGLSRRSILRNSRERSRGSSNKKKNQCYTQLEEEETLVCQKQEFGDDPLQVEETAPLFHRPRSCGNLENELGSTIDEMDSTTLALPVAGRKTPEIPVEETNTTRNDDNHKPPFQSRRTAIRSIRRRSLSLRDRKTLNKPALLEEEGEEKTMRSKQKDFCGGPTLEIDEPQMQEGALFSRPSSRGNLRQALPNPVREIDSPARPLPNQDSITSGTPMEEKVNKTHDNDDSTLNRPRRTRMQDSRRRSLSLRDNKSSKKKAETNTNKSLDDNFPRILRLTRMRSSRIRSLSLRNSRSSNKKPESFNQLEENETLLCQSQDSCDAPTQELDDASMGSGPLIHCPTNSGNLQQELRTTHDDVTSPTMLRLGEDRDSADMPVNESNKTDNDNDNTSRPSLRTSIGISLRRSLSLRDSKMRNKKSESYNQLKEEETLLCQPQSLRDDTAEDDTRMAVRPPAISRTASYDIGTEGSRTTPDRSRRIRGRSRRTRGRSTRRSSVSTRDSKMNKKQTLVEEEETLLCKRLDICDDLAQALDHTQMEKEPRSCGNLLHKSCTATAERDSPALPLPDVKKTSPCKNDNDITSRQSRRNSIQGSLRRSLSLRDGKMSKKKTECYNQLEEEERLVKNPVDKEVTLSDDENTRSRGRRPSTRNRRGRSISLRGSKISKKQIQSYTEVEEEEALFCPSQALDNAQVVGAASLHNLENELRSNIHEICSLSPDKDINSPETIARSTNDDKTPHLSRRIRSLSVGDRKPSKNKSLQMAEETLGIYYAHAKALESTQMEAGSLLYRSRSCGNLLQELRTTQEIDSPAHSLSKEDINLPGSVVEETNTSNSYADNSPCSSRRASVHSSPRRRFSPCDNRTNKDKAMIEEGGELVFSHQEICDDPVDALDHTQIETGSLRASILALDVAGEENENKNTNAKPQSEPQRKRRFPSLNFNHQALDDTDISLDGRRPKSPLGREREDDGHHDSEEEEGVEVLNNDEIIGTTWIQSPGSKPHLELNIETMSNDSGGIDDKETEQKKAAIERAHYLWSQRYLSRAFSRTDEESNCFRSPSPNSLAAQLA